MKLTRRSFVIANGAIFFAALCPSLRAQGGLKFPDPTTFEGGDFVWPKKPGSYVPYNFDPGISEEDDKRLWSNERKEFLSKTNNSQDPEIVKLRNRLRMMSFEQFRDSYLRGAEPGEVIDYGSASNIYTGHVGIIEVDKDQTPFVVEAITGSNNGVVRTKYEDWKKQREGELVWHGRLRGFDEHKRQLIANEAKEFLGKPYGFFNFDLADDKEFYCSKLVWLSTMKALDFAIDGNRQPKRYIWLSPKQILYSEYIDRLVDPGPYVSK